jgi:hypothetical protein
MTSRNTFRVCAIAAAVCAAVAATSGQERTYVLRAARMFDGRDMKTPGLVVVRGDQIIAVGGAAQTPAARR